MTPYERALADRMRAEAASIPLPPPERWVPSGERASRSPWIAAAIVLGIIIATVSVLGEALAPSSRALTTPGPSTRAATRVPADWSVFAERGLLLATPREFGTPQMTQVPTFGGPNAPTLLTQLNFERGLSILVWKGTVQQVLDGHWLRGNPQYTRRPLTEPLSGEEVVTTSTGQSDPAGGPSGIDEARSLFIQLVPDQVIHIWLGPTGAAAPGTATKISSADRALQDHIATHLRVVPDTERHIDRAQVEAILRRVVRQLEKVDVPPGNPDLTRISAGDQWVYNWPNSSQSFAYVVVYPDRAARELDSQQPRALVQWRSPVTQRGVGNVLVLVGSNDANLRYQILAELDALTR